jgi:hypothetical protein
MALFTFAMRLDIPYSAFFAVPSPTHGGRYPGSFRLFLEYTDRFSCEIIENSGSAKPSRMNPMTGGDSIYERVFGVSEFWFQE